MKTLTHYIITNIVNNPDEVEITEQTEGDSTILTIHVDQSDIGIVIGKSGKTIRAIRDVVKVLATKQGKYVDVQIAE